MHIKPSYHESPFIYKALGGIGNYIDLGCSKSLQLQQGPRKGTRADFMPFHSLNLPLCNSVALQWITILTNSVLHDVRGTRLDVPIYIIQVNWGEYHDFVVFPYKEIGRNPKKEIGRRSSSKKGKLLIEETTQWQGHREFSHFWLSVATAWSRKNE